MIIETEHGDVDLRDLDEHPDPEPPEEQHLTLDEITQALENYQWEGKESETLSLLLEQALPQLLHQARAAEAELKERRAVELIESRYTMTGTDQPPARGQVVNLLTLPEANEAAARHESGLGAPVWVQHTNITAWMAYPPIPF